MNLQIKAIWANFFETGDFAVGIWLPPLKPRDSEKVSQVLSTTAMTAIWISQPTSVELKFNGSVCEEVEELSPARASGL